MVNILCIETLGDGGIAHYTYNLVRAIHASGVNISMITTSQYEFEGEKLPVKTHCILFHSLGR